MSESSSDPSRSAPAGTSAAPARLNAIFQLIRLPNLFTAAADPIAGRLLAHGAFGDLRHGLAVPLASVCVYAFGVVVNDIADRSEDATDRPERPIPSGNVSLVAAQTMACGFLASAFILGGLSGSSRVMITLSALIGSVLLYDLVFKNTLLGPLFMGLCRSLNLAVGMSDSPAFGGPICWLACLAHGLFVSGVTWISRSETKFGRTRAIQAGCLIENIAILGYFVVAVSSGRLPNPTPDRPALPIGGLFALAVLALAINLKTVEALRRPEPRRVQAAVKTGILSLIWFEVAMLASTRTLGQAAIVAAFWFPAFVLAKAFRPT